MYIETAAALRADEPGTFHFVSRKKFGLEIAVVVVLVDLYSASRSASNALIVPILRCKKMSFQRRSEAVGTLNRVAE